MKKIDAHELELTYPMRWAPSYYHVNQLITAAYPGKKGETEGIMVHARTRAQLQILIAIAQHLGLNYFGYRDKESRDIFSLQFNNQQPLLDYLGERLDPYGLRNFNPDVNLIWLNRGERAWFIRRFWHQLLPSNLVKKTLKQGLVLADLQQALKHKEERMVVLLADGLDSFDLIINSLT